MNKLSGDLVLALEVWTKQKVDQKDPPSMLTELEAYVQLGIGIQTRHDVFFVFPFSIREHFEYIGEF